MDLRKLFEKKYAEDIADGEISWDELSPEEKSSICEKCGVIIDPEMPIYDGDPVLCNGDECSQETNIRVGVCNNCNEAIHYRYPCKCKRENPNPNIITLCGSTKFKEQFEEANERLTIQGNLVISVGVFGHAKGIELTEQEKQMLDNIHFKKIDIADEIFVINVGGYIGSSTKREIKYATQTGKTVNYLEPIK